MNLFNKETLKISLSLKLHHNPNPNPNPKWSQVSRPSHTYFIFKRNLKKTISPFSENSDFQTCHWNSTYNVHDFLKESGFGLNYGIWGLAECGKTRHSDETRYCYTKSPNVAVSHTKIFRGRISCLASCFAGISLFVSRCKISILACCLRF